MKFESIALEWKECRNAVARFDDYLLRLRLLGFSTFTLIFTGIIGAAGTSPWKEKISPESLLIAIAILTIFVLSIFILDRYYERMLLVTVLRASRLESHRLEGFRIGLTTEIEFQKKQFQKRSIRRMFSQASIMVNFVYALIFLTMWAQYVLIVIKLKSQYIYIIILFVLLIFVLIFAVIGNSLLKEPNSLIARRSQVVNSPIVLSRQEIQQSVKRMAQEIVDWLAKLKEKRLHIVSILVGARPFTEDLLDNMNSIKPHLQFHLHFIHMEAHAESDDAEKQCEIICGTLPPEILRGKNVLVVDNLLDTGTTLKKVIDLIRDAGAKSVKTAVLIQKRLVSLVSPDFLGIQLALDEKRKRSLGIKDCWLFGYGMDFEGHYREIEHIGWVPKK